jgi:hypothetical protein
LASAEVQALRLKLAQQIGNHQSRHHHHAELLQALAER